MECNRDEALRAKKIAEQKFTAKDVPGAKKLALKAQKLNPELEGINQMIATIDVYIAAEEKINGQTDWYSILCLNESADDETVKKQYKKLALQLHPDKNKSVGSEGAFMLLSQAWTVLSDKTRRMVYDLKRRTGASHTRASQPERDHFAEKRTGGAPSSSCGSDTNTFWTCCNKCSMQCEYLRVYLNHSVHCPSCHESFLAIETEAPTRSDLHPGRYKLNPNPKMSNVCGNGNDHYTAQGMENMGFQNGATSAPASAAASAQTTNVVNKMYDKVRRKRELAKAIARREAALWRKNHILKRNASSTSCSKAQKPPIPEVDRPSKRSRVIGDDTDSYLGGNKTDTSGYKAPCVDQCVNSHMDSAPYFNSHKTDTSGYWARCLDQCVNSQMDPAPYVNSHKTDTSGNKAPCVDQCVNSHKTDTSGNKAPCVDQCVNSHLDSVPYFNSHKTDTSGYRACCVDQCVNSQMDTAPYVNSHKTDTSGYKAPCIDQCVNSHMDSAPYFNSHKTDTPGYRARCVDQFVNSQMDSAPYVNSHKTDTSGYKAPCVDQCVNSHMGSAPYFNSHKKDTSGYKAPCVDQCVNSQMDPAPYVNSNKTDTSGYKAPCVDQCVNSQMDSAPYVNSDKTDTSGYKAACVEQCANSHMDSAPYFNSHKTDTSGYRTRCVDQCVNSHMDSAPYVSSHKTDTLGYKAPCVAGKLCVNSHMNSEKARANGVFADFGKAGMSARQFNLSRELAQIDIRVMLIQKAKAAVSKNLEDWNSAVAGKFVEKEKAKQKQKHKDRVDKNATDRSVLDESGIKMNLYKKSTGLGKVAIQHVSIDVPDPDFIDFDKDRSEGSFKGDQVWATYDNEDGMPRFYAIVQKVISLKPFKIRMSFLKSKSNTELGTLNWVASGYTKTCGEFRVVRYETIDTVNIFSHRVVCEKGGRGVIRIFPRKGDTWAVYRNWSPNWNEHTPDDVIHKYDMVEVVDDYNEEQGVPVTPLVKVAGFKTVFQRYRDSKKVKRIPREEMFRFSHQVPSYLFTGEEAHNAPEGCWELDPAATPLELVQVTTEVKEDDVIRDRGR